ncbi:hypothetical protein AB0J57_00240 [Streptomyces sp. NPDC049837]|uniref:hypothetical protein n=1 Tax=Streptomyces sp. NPDC049837 TaxID=3155277 RepID=UPI003439980C
MRRGRMVAVGAVAAGVLGALVAPAMGNEGAGADPALMTEAATGAEQPTASFAPEPSPGVVTQAAWAGPGSVVTRPADFRLKSGADLARKVAKLDAMLPKQGVQKILRYANRPLLTGGDCRTDPFGKGDKGKDPLEPAKKYCFKDDDANSVEWIPQAVTGASDAAKDEKWGAKRPILIGSYDDDNTGRTKKGCKKKASDKCNEKGVRITFVDPATNKYRHALLVWPYVSKKSKKITFDAIHANDRKGQTGIHIGGMAWYKNYLYVADTYNGIRVFDMRKIMDLDPDNKPSTNDTLSGGYRTDVKNKKKIGRHGKTWYGFGYRYVMPQVATWTFQAKQHNKATAGKKNKKKITYCATSGAPKASYLSIDRSVSPHELIMGEYCRSTPSHPSTGRLTGYALDPGTGKLASRGGVTRTPAWGFYLPKEGMQGAARYDGRYYLNQSKKYDNGSIVRAKPFPKRGLLAYGSDVPTAVGPEDLYVEHGRRTGNPALLWSVSEHRPADHPTKCGQPSPCGRVIYAHRIKDIQARP